jgi:hypothetical protein
VREQRLPWLLTSALMLASAASAAWSTYLYWLPCRGTMLEGTIVHPGGGDGRSYEEYEKLDPAVKASMDACLRRMDGDISELAPWTSELGVAATALAGVAWLTLVLGLRWQLRTKAGHASRHRVHHSRRHHHQRDPDRDHDPTETTERCRR